MVLTHRFSVMSLSLMLNQGKAQDSALVAVPSLIRVSSCAHRLKFSAFVFSSVSPQVNSTWGWQGWAPSVLYSLLLAYRGVAPPPLQALHHMWRSVLLKWLYCLLWGFWDQSSTMEPFLSLVCEMTLCSSRQVIRLARCRWGADFLMWKGPLFSPHSLLRSGWSAEGRDEVNIPKIMFLKHNNYDLRV